MSRYKYILLDLDETLFDFHLAEKTAFCELMKMHKIPYSEELGSFYEQENLACWKALEKKEITKQELYSRRFSRIISKAHELFPNEVFGDVDGLEFNRNYMELLGENGFLLEGAEDFLRDLSNIPDTIVCIITNGTTYTAEHRIASSGIGKYIDKLYISDSIGVNKPDVRFFDAVLNDLGNPDKSECLVIGDSLTSDIKGSINAGIDCCLYSRHDHFPQGHDTMPINYRAMGVSGYSDIIGIISSHN